MGTIDLTTWCVCVWGGVFVFGGGGCSGVIVCEDDMYQHGRTHGFFGTPCSFTLLPYDKHTLVPHHPQHQQQVYDPTTPSHILGILDWELATLGHPLADLAYSCMPYVLSGGNGTSTVTGIPVLQNPLPPGIPTMAEYVGMYCKARGVEVPTRQELVYFLALSLFRIAAILAGVGARARMVCC